MIGLILFKADANKVDLLGQDALNESRVASDMGLIGMIADELEVASSTLLIGMMADVLKAGCDDKAFQSKADCDEFKDADKEEVDLKKDKMKLIDKMNVMRMIDLCDDM